MKFLRNLWGRLRQQYDNSERKARREVDAWRTLFVQHAVERLKEDIADGEEAREDNPYNLEALTLFSEATSETSTQEEQTARYLSHQQTHQHLLVNLAHYRTSVPASLLREYFAHWKELEQIHSKDI